jgi:lon-related putative ATP-dependent protease
LSTVNALDASQLHQYTDPSDLGCETTADLSHDAAVIGQERASQAVQFGIGIEQHGYNTYALGPTGTGKRFLVSKYLEEAAARRDVPDDTCYVHNFDESHESRVLRVPAGTGVKIRQDMESLVEDVRSSLSQALESEEYQTRRRVLEQKFEERPESAFEKLREQAKERRFALLRTPVGLVFAPMQDDDEVLPPEEFKKLPEDERERLQEEIDDLQGEVQKILRQVPRWQREMHVEVRALNREVTDQAIGHLFDDLREEYLELPQVTAFLDAVKADIIDHAGEFLRHEAPGEGDGAPPMPFGAPAEPAFLRRYQVNVLVDHEHSEHAPVVFEENPTYSNLLGRVEHLSQLGALITDFHLIRAGALHRANGGYLILDARSLLTQPYAWEALKRSLKTESVRIESLGQALSLVSTVSLEPEPVPLEVKVVMLGDAMLYYLLCEYDPEFSALFKVAADFDTSMDRTEDNQRLYAQLIAGIVGRSELRPFDAGAVARVIDNGARSSGDAEKLSSHTEGLADLLREADYWAGQAGLDMVTVTEVQQAIDAQIQRSDRLRESVQERILRDTVFIDTEGREVGQVNGLSVIQLGQFAFGQPSRITARVRMGKGDVVNIEREVELSGPIHSKGVLILTGFLGARYAADRPLSLSSSLVFEQSYGGVDGDSASSTELYALLSAISGVPLRQDLAVTGSVNQLGRVQPIGGVNEKIEGYFDICQARGLTGDQGVLIPAANVKNLMVRDDVVAAVEAGDFHVYPVTTIDEGIELLTGVPAGDRDAAGDYPEGTINALVEGRLAELTEKQRELTSSPEAKEGS